MLRAHSRARHARIAIGIGEINIPSEKDILIIRAARRQDQRTQDYKLDEDDDLSEHRLISNPQSEIDNPKYQPAFTLLRRDSPESFWGWARQDLNPGPREYEVPALTAELQARPVLSQV